MKKRLLISFTLICFTNSFAVLVELTQAFEYAKNSGVQEKNFDAIKKEFEQNATQEKKIDNIKMQEIVSKFLAAQVRRRTKI